MTCVGDVHVKCVQFSLDQQHAPDPVAVLLLLDQCDGSVPVDATH